MTSEGILPECKHLKFALPYIIVGGVWPNIFNSSKFSQIVYKMYSHFMFYASVCIVLGCVGEFFVLLQDRPLKIEELLSGFSVTTIWTMAIARANGLRKPIFKKLIQNIIDCEKRIFTSGDKDFINIQKSYISKNNFICGIYSTTLSLYTYAFSLKFMFINSEVIDPLLKETVIRQPHTIQIWLPFDKDLHYRSAISLEGFLTVMITYLLIGSEVCSYSIQIYVVSQIKMLNHILMNMDKFMLRIKKQLGCNESEAMFLVLRETILFHQFILEYIKDYNTSMDIVALIDFILLSAQLAACVLPEVIGLPPVIGISYLFLGVIILSKFFVYYWYAEEITSEADKVAESIYNSNWTEKPLKIKYMFIFVMMRSMKMTGLSIGPLGVMSMRVYLMIIRSTYSFVALVHSFF